MISESAIKKSCRLQLEKWNWEVVHIIQCNKNGYPDTLILRAGRAVFIEFKRPGYNPRPLQDYRIRKLREQGFETLIVHRIEDIQHLK